MENASRETQVTGSLNELESTIDILHKIIATLSDRLAPVLRTEVPEALNSKAGVAPPIVPLASIINTRAESIREASRRLRDLTDRLEL